MSAFVLDRTDLAFFSFSLFVACLAVFDTHRLFRILSFGRKTTLTRTELMIIRIPRAIVIVGITSLILLTLLCKK
jgi:hypothetical protein